MNGVSVAQFIPFYQPTSPWSYKINMKNLRSLVALSSIIAIFTSTSVLADMSIGGVDAREGGMGFHKWMEPMVEDSEPRHESHGDVILGHADELRLTDEQMGRIYQIYQANQHLIKDISQSAASQSKLIIEGQRVAEVPVVNGMWRYTLPTGAALAAGGHMIAAQAVDASAKVGSLSNPLAVKIETTAPNAPTIRLGNASDTGTKRDGKTTDSVPIFRGRAEPGVWVNVSIDGLSAGRVRSHTKSGAWSFAAPRLANGVHDVNAVAENRAGLQSAATSFQLTVNGERTVMLDASGGQAVTLMASHLLGQRSQGFIVTRVHSGTLQKWVAAASAWRTISAQTSTNPSLSFPKLAELGATGNAAKLRTISFTDTVRWIPASGDVGTAPAFTLLPLDKAGGAIALPPQPGTVPGKVEDIIIGDCCRGLGTRIMWNAPTDGCDCRSTRYSIEVILVNGRTFLYNVPSTVHTGSSGCGCGSTRYSIEVILESGRTFPYNVPSTVHIGSSAEDGAVVSFSIWGATTTGAGEVQTSSSTSSFAAASRSSCNTCNPSSCPPDICSGYGTPVCCPSGSGSTTCCATGGGR